MNNFYFSVSTFTKGEQMVPVLNRLGVHCAVYGNHDFGLFSIFVFYSIVFILLFCPYISCCNDYGEHGSHNIF